jgi:hypothetical protein
MTVIVDQALREYLGKYETEGDQDSQPGNPIIYDRNS